MKKGCLGCLGCGGVIVIGFAILIITAYNYLGTAVKEVAEEMVPQITQTDFKIENLDLALLSGQVKLDGLELANTKGFKEKNVFEIKEFNINLGVTSLLSDTIILEEFVFDGLHINFELLEDLSTTNIVELKKNIDRSTGNYDETGEKYKKEVDEVVKLANPAGGLTDLIKKFDAKDINKALDQIDKGLSSETPEIPEEKKIGKKLIIKRFYIGGGKITAYLPYLKKPVTFEMETIELLNLGENTEDASETIYLLVKAVTETANKSIKKYLKKEFLKDIKKSIDKDLIKAKGIDLLDKYSDGKAGKLAKEVDVYENLSKPEKKKMVEEKSLEVIEEYTTKETKEIAEEAIKFDKLSDSEKEKEVEEKTVELIEKVLPKEIEKEKIENIFKKIKDSKKKSKEEKIEDGVNLLKSFF